MQRHGSPAKLGWPHCTRTAERSGRLATASSACQTRTGWHNCKARPRRLRGETRIVACGNLNGDVQPAASGSVRYGGVLDLSVH